LLTVLLSLFVKQNKISSSSSSSSVVVLVGTTSYRKAYAALFQIKSDSDEIWQECSWSKSASIDVKSASIDVFGFLI